MSLSVFQRQLLGLDESALVCQGSQLLLAPVWTALGCLTKAAAREGFQLRVASAYRSYARQQKIWNDKIAGDRAVVDDADRVVDMAKLNPEECIACVLRFSALPGASRHHWGTDIDVFDAAAVEDDYRVQLSAAEVAPGGPFDPLHAWLDERIADGHSFGFYRPYDKDRGGVAPERWHLSFAPLASGFQRECTMSLLRVVWSDAATGELQAQKVLDQQLESIFERFVTRVAAPPKAALEFLPPV